MRRRPLATHVLAGITVGAFVFALVARLPHLFYQAGFVPLRAHEPLPFAAVPFALTPLTATLLHGGWLHLGFNMLMLIFCGRMVESVLGARRTLLLYGLGAYGAAAGQFLVDTASPTPMVGASGAISALIAAYALMYGRAVPGVAGVPGMAVRAAWLLAAWVAIQWLVGAATATGETQIATAAHVGGFAVGLAVTVPALRSRFATA